MKLLICLECGDIFNLTFKEKTCGCGETSGKYIDSLNAEIKGNCQPIGFSNKKFKMAYQLQKYEDAAQENKPICCDGVPFDAFFIPEAATSIKRIKKDL